MNGNNTTPNVTSPCEALVDKETFTYYSLAASAGIIILLSFFEKRKNSKCQACRKRPGILVPANLLDGQTNTIAYAAAFGCTASSCLSLILYDSNINNNIPEQSPQNFPQWAQVFLWMLIVLEIGTAYYPFFACLSSKCLIVSSAIGFCYSVVWFLVQLDDVIECPPPVVLFKGEDAAIELPVFICLLFLILKFGHTFVTEVYNRINRKLNRGDFQYSSLGVTGRPEINKPKHLAQEFQLQYVKRLLRKQDLIGPRSELETVTIQAAIKFHCQRDPTFRYSPRIIAAFTVAVVCIFEWGFKLLLTFASLLNFSYDALENNKETMSNYNGTTVYKQLHLFVDVTTFSGTIALGLSTIIITFHVFNIFRSYRDHLRRLYKGDYSYLSKDLWNIPASEIMTYSLHYAGIQIAVLLIGYIVLILVIYLLGLLVAYFIVLPFLKLVPDDFLQPFYAILPAKLITIVFFYVQRLICNKVLLDETKVNDKDTDKPHQVLALNNRKTYHNFSYYFFFLYIILGAYKCFERITKGIFLGTLYLARMDRSALMQGFETWDNGYMAYISFLRMEVTHCHPVLVVFCDLMQKVKAEKQLTSSSCVPIPSTAESNDTASISSTQSFTNYQSTYQISTYDRQIQNRWMKCYTLVRNPTLVEMCKRCLCQETGLKLD